MSAHTITLEVEANSLDAVASMLRLIATEVDLGRTDGVLVYQATTARNDDRGDATWRERR